jgi:peptidoglycan/xylan/chitin deacetylase (PgdA/CDA1 family)
MRLFRPSFLAVRIFPDALFREITFEKVLYLTFDDGPDVSSTLTLLETLAKHGVKAVFFCSGKKASENPDLVEKIREEEHIIGNHGFNHLNGFCTGKEKYLNDINKAVPFTSGNLFRPPFGRLRINQYREIKKAFKIVFWDVMPYDFDSRFGSARTLSVLKKQIRPGSVIVLHDSPGSTNPEFLEQFIVFAKGQGYRFETVK